MKPIESMELVMTFAMTIKNQRTRVFALTLLVGTGSLCHGQDREPFPALIPMTKPTERPLSAAIQRLYDVWNPHEDRGNELYSNFKYTPLKGLSYDGYVSRRDPSKVLKINGRYYVWYTHRDTKHPPSGPNMANATTPSFDWDLCEIWYATSKDGFTWEEQGPAVGRPPQGDYGWRSVSTPDILAWGGKYYLYYQGFNEIPGLKGDRAAATVAESDSPDGPWRAFGRVVVDFGAKDEWDSNAIHDPYPIVFRGRIHLYYKGSPGKQGKAGTVVRAQGVAIADHPLGPFTKSPLNPVLNSGHETCFFPWKTGVVGIVSLDGPEKNTVQFSPDGINFKVESLLQVPPIAPGPFAPDAFADNGDGRGITWGLCHINPDGGSPHAHSILARFDCDLSLDVDRRAMKNNNLRFDERTYLQERVKLPQYLDDRVRRDRENVDMDTISYGTGAVAKKPSTRAGAPQTFEVPDTKAFPAVMPLEKPSGRKLSTSWARMWDRWDPHEDRGNELYSNFKYLPIEGLKHQANVSRRDPTKVIRVGDKYYVWYTCRRTDTAPVGLKKATDRIPATDWDLADIWYATSDDGYTWTEQGVAVKRPPKPIQGYRSICTPDILMWKDRYYLYFQAYSPMVGGSAFCPVMAAVADSPDGPWILHEKPVITPGPQGSWNDIKINDPYLLVVNGRILMYYKGAPKGKGDQYVLRMQGVSFADDPLGPFIPSRLNPVINSGHETCMWPWKGGVAALVALDGPEKNTIQFAPDGENFEVMSMLQIPPIAPGPFVPDAFASGGDGRGFTWGLAHINPDGGGAASESRLIRFDCDLSLNVDRPVFKRNNLRFEQSTYFQPGVRLPDNMRKQIDRERDRVDRDTILNQ
ncbi:MAG: family 43 glycosylhydrolase [Fuerstiella sp.]|nr:family 43 glycosylhydrolase [Fuerstiella sp.]